MFAPGRPHTGSTAHARQRTPDRAAQRPPRRTPEAHHCKQCTTEPRPWPREKPAATPAAPAPAQATTAKDPARPTAAQAPAAPAPAAGHPGKAPAPAPGKAKKN